MRNQTCWYRTTLMVMFASIKQKLKILFSHSSDCKTGSGHALREQANDSKVSWYSQYITFFRVA